MREPLACQSAFQKRQRVGVCVSAFFRADFWAGNPTKHFSVKKKGFSVKRGRDSVKGGFGKDCYRKGNSVKRSGPFSELPDSEN